MARALTTSTAGLGETPNSRNVERNMRTLSQTLLRLCSWRTLWCGWPSTRGPSRLLATSLDPISSCQSWVRSRPAPTMAWPMRRLLQNSRLSLLFEMQTSCDIDIPRVRVTSTSLRGSSRSWNVLRSKTTWWWSLTKPHSGACWPCCLEAGWRSFLTPRFLSTQWSKLFLDRTARGAWRSTACQWTALTPTEPSLSTAPCRGPSNRLALLSPTIFSCYIWFCQMISDETRQGLKMPHFIQNPILKYM